MSFLDQLAFGPGRDRRAWARGLLMAIAVLAVAAVVLYFSVSGDYAFLRASVLPGLRLDTITRQGSDLLRAPSRGTATWRSSPRPDRSRTSLASLAKTGVAVP